ncbi:MAG: hypothetical protein NC131_07170 [Roseburia sp.]|nr:hypothetical protein [Roseburia sp.]
MKTQKTFREMCAERKEMPTPFQQFIAEVAEITCRAENTVLAWGKGQQTPDKLAQKQIAEHFGVDIETLFPTDKNDIDNENA